MALARPEPDGRFIAYASAESGRIEVYVQRFPLSSDKWQISSGGGLQPLWRGDGKELFFITDEKKVMSVDIKTDGTSFESSIPRELFQSGLKTGFGYSYAVASDGHRFLISAPVDAGDSAPMTIVLNWAAGLKSAVDGQGNGMPKSLQILLASCF